jgi:hypothetical protein
VFGLTRRSFGYGRKKAVAMPDRKVRNGCILNPTGKLKMEIPVKKSARIDAWRNFPMRLRSMLLTIALLVWGSTLKADIILNSTDTGWYNNSGFHDSANTNYIAGDEEAMEFRDFFVFDLTGITGPIVSAELSLFNPCFPFPGYMSPNPSETYQVTNVTTAITTLVSSNTGATAIFSDLGTNTPYGYNRFPRPITANGL